MIQKGMLPASILLGLLLSAGCGSNGKDGSDNGNGGSYGGPLLQSRERAARESSSLHLKQLGLAIHQYSSDTGRLPPAAARDPQGKALLSWRVLILPQLGHQNLYRKFRLNEPWDSPNNKPLLKMMPKQYHSKASKAGSDQTHFRVFVGNNTLFPDNPGAALRLSFVTNADGTANTILVVEAGKAVPWTSPEEIPYNPGQPLPDLRGLYPHSNGFLVLTADGATRYLTSTSDTTLRNAITWNDGKVLGSDW